MAKSEYVFYFLRLHKRGLYYTLFKEFAALTQPYSIMPLVRPTESTLLRAALERNAASNDAIVHHISQSLLQSKADKRGGNEFIPRPQLNSAPVVATARAAGASCTELPQSMGRADDTAFLTTVLCDSTGKKRGRTNLSTAGPLESLSRSGLLAIATKEGVKTTSRMNKAGLLAAIIQSRALPNLSAAT